MICPRSRGKHARLGRLRAGRHGKTPQRKSSLRVDATGVMPAVPTARRQDSRLDKGIPTNTCDAQPCIPAFSLIAMALMSGLKAAVTVTKG